MAETLDRQFLATVKQEEVPAVAPSKVREKKLTAGVELTKLLLSMMCGFFVVATAVLVGVERHADEQITQLSQRYSPTVASTADTIAAAQTPLDRAWADRLTVRKLWTEIFEKVLFQLLLPLTTAVLGYTFGTQHSRDPA